MSVYHYCRPTQRSLLNELMRDFGMVERTSEEKTSSEITNNDAKFSINLNVSQFKPDELKVNLDGLVLTIQGEQEFKSENGYTKKSFSRVLLLPEDVDFSKVSSSLSEDGKLLIEAPKMEMIQGREIPIQQAVKDSE